MKRYYNKKTGAFATLGAALTYNITDNEVFSGIPTAEQLVGWGFTPYDDTNEVTEAEQTEEQTAEPAAEDADEVAE